MAFPWLTAMAVIPLLGALGLLVMPNDRDVLAKKIAFFVSCIPFVLTVGAALRFDKTRAGEFQLTESHAWIPSFGVDYAVGVDGIALLLIALTTTLVPIVILAGWNDVDGMRNSIKGYFALILLLESTLIVVFAATDLFVFYVMFEVMLFPMYFMIGRYGGPQRQYAAVKFLLYSLFGGLLMLASLIGLFVVSANQLGTGTFDFTTLASLSIDEGTQKWLFLGFFIAFAIKAPLVPFHTWLPDAAAESTPGTAVLMVGVMDKVATFGMLRYCLELFPDASKYFTPVIVVMCLIGIIYGALLAIGQTDLKRLIAYTSVSHFGFIGLGIFAMTSNGQSGSALYMINHGFSTAALFLLAGWLISRRGSRFIDDFGGVSRVAPIFAGTFMVAGLSSLALPGLSSFVSEFLVLLGSFERWRIVGVIATLGIVLAALYILIMYQKTMTGEPSDVVRERVGDLRSREVWAIAPVLAMIVALGVAPQIALDVINPAVGRVMTAVGATDPVPTVPVVAGAEGTQP